MLKRRTNKNIYRLSAAIALFIISFSYISFNSAGTPYDAGYYWTTADLVFIDGFHLLNFPETFRGYFLPVLLSGIKLLFPGLVGWNILSSLMIALLISYVLPFIFGKSINSPLGLVRAIITGAVFLFFWGKFAAYPLSDLPATFFMCAGVALIKKSCETENKYQRIICGYVCGAALYAAYNVRAIFLFGTVILIVGVIFLYREKWKSLLPLFAACLLGACLIAIPQCVINHQYVGVFSPKVYTEALYGYSHDLQMQQVFWGLSVPRYETYIGDTAVYPNPGVNFTDPAGVAIISKEGLTVDNFSYFTFLKLCLKYPLDMLGIYTRHLISALTICFSSAYIQDFYEPKGILISLSIILWLLAGVALSAKILKREWNAKLLVYSAALVIPSGLQLLGAVEIRFALPIYLLTYSYIAQIVDWKETFVATKGYRGILILSLAIIFILWATVIGDILSRATGANPILLISG